MKTRQIVVILIACLMLGYDLGQQVHATTIKPGSSDDPIVSVEYVKKYIGQAFKPVDESLAGVDKNLKLVALQTIKIKDALKLKVVFVIGQKTAKIGNKTFRIEAPISYKGRTILPLRFIGEALKAQVIWEGKTKKIIYKKDNTVIILRINDAKANVNGKVVKLDVAPLIKNASVFVPVRFISENFNAQVDYISKTKTVIIKEK